MSRDKRLWGERERERFGLAIKQINPINLKVLIGQQLALGVCVRESECVRQRERDRERKRVCVVCLINPIKE